MRRNCVRNQVSIVGTGNNVNIYTPHNYSDTDCNWVPEDVPTVITASAIIAFILFVCIVCCCCCYSRRRRDSHGTTTRFSNKLAVENC